VRVCVSSSLYSGKRPDVIEIWYENEDVSSSTLDMTVGSVMRALSVRILDECGDEVDENHEISVSAEWLARPIRIKGASGISFDLTLPEAWEELSQEVTVACDAGGLEPCSFFVKLRADAPVRWNILHDDSVLKVCCDDFEGLRSKISGED
jgi:hypothetical protein